MKITNSYSPSFGIKFVKNNAYRNLVRYAKENGLINDFNSTLNILEKKGTGEVHIRYGKDANNREFSTFSLGNITVENTPYDGETGLEATYRCFMDLSLLGGRYRTLTGTNVVKTRAGA